MREDGKIVTYERLGYMDSNADDDEDTTPSSQVCNVNVCVPELYQAKAKANADGYTKFVLGLLSPAAQFLTVDMEVPFNSIAQSIPSHTYAHNLRAVHLEQTTLSMFEMLNFIKQLPGMTSLACRLDKIDRDLYHRGGKTLLDQPHQRYKLLNPPPQLRFWHVCHESPAPKDAMAITAVTLALTCPRFTFAYLQGGGDIYHYQDILKNAIEGGLYRKHTRIPRKLFYNAEDLE
ncbi:hypothetical protein EV175_000159 [Coemansia sp. RSA 1933]|nr:hypothetical protein EV175_000159 [Coemansia sp. RSA 1933]